MPMQVSEDRKRFLLNYVQKVEPQIMEQFAQHAPPQVSFLLTGLSYWLVFRKPKRPLTQGTWRLMSDRESGMQVVDAMRTTISNMVGMLPPHLFDVTVSTVGESLAQLMLSVIMTGVMLTIAMKVCLEHDSVQNATGPTWHRDIFLLYDACISIV